MTLSTNVYVLDEVDPHEVFRFCQGLLAKYDGRGDTYVQEFDDRQDKTYRNGESFVEPGNPWTLSNAPGQNLPAWLLLSYRPGAPLLAEDAEHDEDCDEDCSGKYHDRAHWLNVDFDTSYGYRDHQNRGCGDLHALIVAELGHWLGERNIRWAWRNEFTGEVHDGPEQLIELVSGGFEATAWFQTTVMPAIAAHIARGEVTP